MLELGWKLVDLLVIKSILNSIQTWPTQTSSSSSEHITSRVHINNTTWTLIDLKRPVYTCGNKYYIQVLVNNFVWAWDELVLSKVFMLSKGSYYDNNKLLLILITIIISYY